MFRQTYKQDAKHFMGFRSTNYGPEIKNSEAKALLKISPLGAGRLANIKQKAESIYGASYLIIQSEVNSTKEIILNPLWGYIILVGISYQKLFISPKKTQAQFEQDYTREVVNELRFRKLQLLVKEELKNRIQYIFNHLESAFQRIMKRDEGLSKSTKLQKLIFFRKWIAEQAENVKLKAVNFILEATQESKDKDKKFQNYVEQLLIRLQAIEPLKISQQYIKFKLFEKIHKETFQSQILTEKISGVNCYYLKVGKISSETEPVLQRLTDFVQLRLNAGLPNEQYKVETASFIKDLYTQLQKYEGATGKTGFRSYYYYLSPQNVIIDQLTLTPKLHYEPVLMQTLGLQRDCFSIETRLSLQPTPKGPDFFRALEELDEDNQLKLKDPLYGMIDLYDYEKSRMTPQEIQEIKNEKIQKQKLKVLITVWRYLLVSYYIKTGSEYGRKQNPISYQQVQKHYEKNLRKAKSALYKDATHLEQFLGIENQRYQGIRFEWRLQQIGEYLQFENDDSIVKEFKFNNKLRYFMLRWSFLIQLNNTLKNNKIIPKFLNVKRYILMYLLSAIQIYSENRELIEAEKKKSGQRKILRKLFEQRPQEMRIDCINDAKSSMDNINKYLSRNPDKDNQTKYLLYSNKYILTLLNDILKELLQINQICQQLNTIQNKEENAIPLTDRNTYKSQLARLEAKLDAGYQKVHRIAAEFVTSEIYKKPLEELNKYTEQERQREINKLQKKKVVLLFFTYLSLNSDKYFFYETAVAPLLITFKNQNQTQDPNKQAQKLQEMYYQLQAVEQAIDLNTQLPKQLKHYKPQVSTYQSTKMQLQINQKEGGKLLQRKECFQKKQTVGRIQSIQSVQQ